MNKTGHALNDLHADALKPALVSIPNACKRFAGEILFRRFAPARNGICRNAALRCCCVHGSPDSETARQRRFRSKRSPGETSSRYITKIAHRR